MRKLLMTIFGAITFLVSVSTLSTVEAYANSGQAAVSETKTVTATGWQYANGNWYFYKSDGKLATGWINDNNNWYLLNSNGVMQTGWSEVNGKWYYLKYNGAMETGWLKSSNKWYYLNTNADMAIGWKKVDDHWFYLTSTGVMKTGWLALNNKWYFLNGGGQMMTGWINPGNTWYYMNDNGDMATGWKQLGNDRFYLTSSGAMKTGWLELNNNWYFLNGSGQMMTGWIAQNKAWYYLAENGVMAKGFITDEGHTYYLSDNGDMKTGFQTIQEGLYYFNRNGSMHRGWLEMNGDNYYFNPSNGKALTGQVMVEGNAYLFNNAGVLQPDAIINGWMSDGQQYYYYVNNQKKIGWLDLEGKWYYLNESGVMTTGWQLIKGKWYYLAANGTMQTGWINLSGKYYYLNKNGDMHTGWLHLASKWYYLNSSGVMLTGQQSINNKIYFFDGSGAWTIGSVVSYANYARTLDSMLNIQLGLNPPPQTDKYRNAPAYVSSEYIELNKDNPKKGKTTVVLNVREAATDTSHSFGKLSKGAAVDILNEVDGWYEIKYSEVWRNAKSDEAKFYMDPTNFNRDSNEFNQFLVLSQSAETNAQELNDKALKGKGILAGKGAAFLKASEDHKINEVYLIAHAILETGHGSSELANGVMINGVKVYNMFGIKAYDKCPVQCGAQHAYDQGWTTPEKAIMGGAKFISEQYINHASYKQDTLYKMRWNPANPGKHQYATDMAWGTKQSVLQTRIMKDVYDSLDAYTLYFEVPVYQ